MLFIKLIRNILNFFDYFQQNKIINFLKNYLHDEIILFDVGSHYGETVKLFSKNFKIKKIHCFEASPDNFEKLSKIISENNLQKICVLNNTGVGLNEYPTFINQTKESSSSTINSFNTQSKYLRKKLRILNINKIDNFYKKTPIKMTSLDNYIRKEKIQFIDVLKIDTEGFEFNVLKGLNDNFKLIKFIYFEHHYDDMIIKHYNFGDIHQLLKSYGFKMLKKSKMLFRKSFEYIYENKKN